MKRFFIFGAAAAVFAGSSSAASLSVSLVQNWTDNLFQTRYAAADAMTAAGIAWEKSFSEFGLFAGLDYSALRENSGMSLASLSGGADYLQALGDKTALYLSVAGNASLFQAEYSDFNYEGVRIAASLKSYLTPSSIFKAAAVSEFRSYRYAPFDFLSQGLSVSLDKYFSSRTTLQAELGWGYKYFFHPQTIAPEADAAGLVPPEGGGGFGYVGYGNGGYRHGGYGGGNRGGGEYAPAAEAAAGKGIQVASFQARAAQGLGERVGLRLGGIIQWNVSGENPFSTVEEFMMIENPTSDAFSWEGMGWNAQLSALLPWNVNARLGYNTTEMTFPGIESRDLEGNPLGFIREDKRSRWEISAEKDFGRWSLKLMYAQIRNASNDPLFDWGGGFLSGGLQWGFDWGAK